jgi:hypothetical protein
MATAAPKAAALDGTSDTHFVSATSIRIAGAMLRNAPESGLGTKPGSPRQPQARLGEAPPRRPAADPRYGGGRSAPRAALRSLAVANLAGDLPIRVTFDGRRTATESRYAWSGGGLVLTIATVLPEAGLALELISTYVGHQDTDTIATQLTVGQGQEGRIETSHHRRDELNPTELARACAYDHVSRLLSALADRSLIAQADLDERTFHELERVE